MYLSNISLYPNPSNGLVFINNQNNFYGNVKVTDLEGRKIYEAVDAIKANGISEINLSKVVTGVYFITVYNDDFEKLFRVVKQ
jgi:hypothetical protein